MFGHLKVLKEIRSKIYGRAWLCECDCKDKTQIELDSHRLTSGRKTHCGCQRTYKKRDEIEFPEEYMGKTKICTKCGEDKEYKDFYFKEYINKDGIKSYGFNPTCIECDKEDSKNRILNNRESHLKALKKNNARPETRLIKRENTRKRREAGYFYNFFEKYPEKLKEYYNNHRQHDISTKEWNNELKVFDYKCVYCDISETDAKKKYGERLHKDHVIYDGYNDIRNSAPACKDCNSKKWQTEFEKWFREQEFFSEDKLELIKWWTSEGYKLYIEDKPPYRITKSRVYKEDSSYTYQFELWSVDEKRNFLECIAIGNKKKEMDKKLKELMK